MKTVKKFIFSKKKEFEENLVFKLNFLNWLCQSSEVLPDFQAEMPPSFKIKWVMEFIFMRVKGKNTMQ